MDVPEITLTCTTGRRLKCFKKTMRSFLDRCLDKDRVIRYIVSDDGSSDDDFEEMRRYYPFIEFYRSPKRGQAASLNFLFSKVETEWFFHLEDDWRFVGQGNFLQMLFDVAATDFMIKNILMTKWEPLSAGCLKKTESGIGYVIHKFDPTVPKEVAETTDSSWFGWSLNPGLQNKPVLDELGPFDEAVTPMSRLWDKEQAKLFRKLGYKRASLYPERGQLIRHLRVYSLYDINRSECRAKRRCSNYPECEGCRVPQND